MEKGLGKRRRGWSSSSTWGSGKDAGRCADEYWWF